MKKHLLTLAIALLPSFQAHADIAIGFAAPLTGQYAVLGEQAHHGYEQAIADINAQGGVLGQKLVAVEADDACDPKIAVAVANQMVSKGVKFIVGHLCSGASIPTSKIYNEEGIFMISPSSTNPALTDSGLSNVFRVCGRDDEQGKVQAHYVLRRFPGAKIAILHDNSTGGKGQAEQFKKTINEAGIHEVMFESYMTGQRDYSALIAKIKNLGVQVLDIGGFHTEVGLIARQLKEQGAHVQIMGGDALVTDEFWSITGPAGEGVLMTFSPDPRNRPEVKPILDELRKPGFEPEGYTLYAYAAMQVIAEGIRRAGVTDPMKVAHLVHRPEIKTVLGPLTFNDKGDVSGSTYVVYRWHDGKYTEIRD